MQDISSDSVSQFVKVMAAGEEEFSSDGIQWDQLGLSKFTIAMAAQFIQKNTATPELAADFERVHAWLNLLGSTRKPLSTTSHQKGCPEIIPGLQARPEWDAAAVPGLQDWVNELWLPNRAAILGEVVALRKPSVEEGMPAHIAGFQEYRAPSWAGTVPPAALPTRDETSEPATARAALGDSSTASGTWNVYYLDLHNVDTSENRARCPVLSRVVDALPCQYGHAFLSAMAPGTHITPHHGPTNKKLRIQLPLALPAGSSPVEDDGRVSKAGCAVRVADCTLRYSMDTPLVFDDSFEHEAWNMCPQPRLVLIVDVWHPDLTAAERKFLQFLRKAQLRAAKTLSAQASEQGVAGADFFAILEDAASRPVAAASVLECDLQGQGREAESVGGVTAGNVKN